MNGFGSLIGGAVDILAAIPRAFLSLFEGLLGSGRSGNWREVHEKFRILIRKLPSQLQGGDSKGILATIHSMLELLAEMAKQLGRGKITGMADLLADFIDVVLILQAHVRNPGARAVLANVNIELHLLLFNMRSSNVDNAQLAASFKRLMQSLTAVFNGIKTGSANGGFSIQLGALQNIFFLFNMLQSESSGGASSATISDLLQQLTFLFDGLEMTASSQSSRSILHSIAINLDLALKRSTSRGISHGDLLSLLRMAGNSLNAVFDLSGISGAGKFVGSGGSSADFLQQISLALNNLKVSIRNNDMDSIQSLISKLGN